MKTNFNFIYNDWLIDIDISFSKTIEENELPINFILKYDDIEINNSGILYLQKRKIILNEPIIIKPIDLNNKEKHYSILKQIIIPKDIFKQIKKDLK